MPTFGSTLLEEVAVEGGSRVVDGVPVVVPAPTYQHSFFTMESDTVKAPTHLLY